MALSTHRLLPRVLRNNMITLMIFVLLASSLPLNAQECDPSEDCQWNYFLPSSWPTICDGVYKLCGEGKLQSPIDIDTSKVVLDSQMASRPLILHYQTVNHNSVVNLGSTIHLDVNINNTVSGGPLPNQTLLLEQMRFHAPSEHRINGASSAAEVKLIHSSDANQTVIIVVRIQVGTTNAWLNKILKVRDSPSGPNSTIDINPLQAFPPALLSSPHKLKYENYYYFLGSMTTPPCTEGVHWIVLIDPIYASQDQIDQLQSWEGINNRPIQKAYNGTVYQPNYEVAPKATEQEEDIRHMGLVIGISFISSLATFFGIVAIAVFALHLKDRHSTRDFYGAQQFEIEMKRRG